MIQVNKDIVNGFKPFPLDGFYFSNIPPFADPACLSNAEQAPWTNRVPSHEPWARTMMGDTTTNGVSDQCEYNTSHSPQFVDDGGNASYDIGRVEGEVTTERGPYWRR